MFIFLCCLTPSPSVQSLCEPQSYRPMHHEDFKEDLRKFRLKSRTWAGERSKRDLYSRLKKLWERLLPLNLTAPLRDLPIVQLPQEPCGFLSHHYSLFHSPEEMSSGCAESLKFYKSLTTFSRCLDCHNPSPKLDIYAKGLRATVCVEPNLNMCLMQKFFLGAPCSELLPFNCGVLRELRDVTILKPLEPTVCVLLPLFNWHICNTSHCQQGWHLFDPTTTAKSEVLILSISLLTG